jgi:hypothetical protein
VREPNFFNTDFSSELRKFTNKQEYLRKCFADSESDTTYVAEKTVWYLYSKQAVANIHQFNPEAKCIVMVRNPITLMQSLYKKLFEIQQETVDTFRQAWKLQDKRRAGKRVPPSCPDSRLLLYREVGRLGKQLQRVEQVLPSSQYKVILFDDFTADTQKTYNEVLSWLDLSSRSLADTGPINGKRSVRSPGLQYALRQASQSLYRPVSGVSEAVKDTLGIKRWNLMYGLSQLNTRPSSEDTISDELFADLVSSFRSDIQAVEEITGRNLSHWTKREEGEN